MARKQDLVQIMEDLGSELREIKSSRTDLNRRLDQINSLYQRLNTLLRRMPSDQVSAIQNSISITLPNEARTDEPSWKRYGLIPIPMEHREFFPGYRVPFILVTDIGEIETYVTSAFEGTRTGHRREGKYIAKGIKAWYRRHPRLKAGDEIGLEELEQKRRYNANIIHN